MLRRITALTAAAAITGAVLLSGSYCAPTVDYFTPGVAKVNGEYVVYFPFCQSVPVQQYHVMHWDTGRPVDERNPEEVLWAGEDPSGVWQRHGWVVIGSAAGFATASPALVDPGSFPNEVWVGAFTGANERAPDIWGDWVDLAGAPSYDGDVDWTAIEFLARGELRTPKAILEFDDRCPGIDPLAPAPGGSEA